jgi:hypothetical protein
MRAAAGFQYSLAKISTIHGHWTPKDRGRQPDAGECIVYRVLKFEQRVLNIESLALRMFGMLIAQGGCKNRVLLKLMSSPSGVHGTPSRQQRYSVNTADGVPRLLPYEPSVRRFTTTKIVKAASRAIGAKFQARQLPSRSRWPQRGEL